MARRVVKKREYSKDFIMSPKNDFVFKLLFGDKENIENLKALLSAILKIKESEFENIKILNTELVKEFKEDKKGILDIRAEISSGEQIDIEIQVSLSTYMPARSLYYWSRMYTKQLRSGDSFRKLKQCIAINILDFNCMPVDKLHTTFHIMEKETGYIMTDLLQIHFLELPKLTKAKNEDIASNKDLIDWLSFINSETKEEMEMLAEKNQKIKKAYEELTVISKDEKKRMIYEAREAEIKDRVTREEEAEERGLKKGEIKGRLEGKLEGKLEFLLLILNKKFKTLPTNIENKIRKLSDLETIEKIISEIFEISSIEELDKYL